MANNHANYFSESNISENPPNKGVQMPAYSLCSYVAPAFGSS